MIQVSYGSDGKTSILEASICKHVEVVGSRENHRLSHHEMSGTFSRMHNAFQYAFHVGDLSLPTVLYLSMILSMKESS